MSEAQTAIKINEDFEFNRYAYGWELHEWTDGKDKNGNSKRSMKISYYMSLSHLCNTVVDKTAGKASSVADILCAINSVKDQIVEAVRDIERGHYSES